MSVATSAAQPDSSGGKLPSVRSPTAATTRPASASGWERTMPTAVADRSSAYTVSA
eukprot:CAMPEP_0202790478 /NCGR_PEP_ID=MMETSP1388-20130828/79539_1 /ASSEMBLY_ACC=CAM_ASM_000864 /TAXON_ID=37098 /ORGANISM="Isochrysis sp, Strain CCMP1244" /LENGTH=55 /DNA_ID=CAMNT_0049460209 /DNA_START=358 /DNA_END=522 /DNA_ORIENTATION=+